MRKLKNAIAQELLGASGWEHKYFVVDFSHDVTAGALTIVKSAIVLPIANTSLQLGSPDEFPPLLTAAVGNRKIGTGGAPLGILTGVFLAHYTPGSPATIYNPAGTTVQVKATSSVTTTGSNPDNLTAAFNAATGANLIDAVAITAPANRQPQNPNGTGLLTTAAMLFAGDLVDITYITAGAIDNTGKVLSVILQVD
jgi:hypothetical protein